MEEQKMINEKKLKQLLWEYIRPDSEYGLSQFNEKLNDIFENE